jgi:hypothetical protein
VRGQHFISESILVDHNLKVNVHILAACQVISLLFLFLSLHVLHLHSPFLSLLLNALDLV